MKTNEYKKPLEKSEGFFAFSAGRYYSLSEKNGNSFLTKESACKKELDTASEYARLNVERGGYHPDEEYPGRGFEKDIQGNWVYKKYKVADIEYYPELEITEEFEIPDRIREKYEVNSICYEAFLGCKELRKLIIPKSIVRIAETAFAGCENLSEIVISKNITRIENYAFINCKALTELIIPENVKWLGRGIFDGCDALRSVTILNPEIEMDEDMIPHWCKPKYIVIHGKEGSTAQMYAEKKKIPFKVI